MKTLKIIGFVIALLLLVILMMPASSNELLTDLEVKISNELNIKEYVSEFVEEKKESLKDTFPSKIMDDICYSEFSEIDITQDMYNMYVKYDVSYGQIIYIIIAECANEMIT